MSSKKSISERIEIQREKARQETNKLKQLENQEKFAKRKEHHGYRSWNNNQQADRFLSLPVISSVDNLNYIECLLFCFIFLMLILYENIIP